MKGIAPTQELIPLTQTNDISVIQIKMELKMYILTKFKNENLIFFFINIIWSHSVELEKYNNNNNNKGIVLWKMKITPWFIHPQAILCAYDFLLSDEYSRSYI